MRQWEERISLQEAGGEHIDAEGKSILRMDAAAVGALGKFPTAGEAARGEDDAEMTVDGQTLEFRLDACLGL